MLGFAGVESMKNGYLNAREKPRHVVARRKDGGGRKIHHLANAAQHQFVGSEFVCAGAVKKPRGFVSTFLYGCLQGTHYPRGVTLGRVEQVALHRRTLCRASSSAAVCRESGLRVISYSLRRLYTA